MALKKACLSAIIDLSISVTMLGLSVTLAVAVPEEGKAINPFLTLLVYMLPITAIYLISNGIYQIYLVRKGMPCINLGDAVILWIRRRWKEQEMRHLEKDTREEKDI